MQKNMFEQTSWIIQYVLQIVPWIILLLDVPIEEERAIKRQEKL